VMYVSQARTARAVPIQRPADCVLFVDNSAILLVRLSTRRCDALIARLANAC